MIVRLIRYLRGYVRFLTRSGSVERFMNLCAHHHIPTWGGRRNEASYSGYTSVSGYRRMRPLARKAGVRTRVEERRGLPFLLHRYRRRAGIAAGVLLAAGFLMVTQQFIWVIEVEGCARIEPRVLLNVLEELGVKRGSLKHSIDTRDIQQQVVIRVDELAWATLNIRGTSAQLLVRERIAPPPKIDTGVPANVVAARDGQIKKLEVTDGKALLKAGDTVRAGDIIVSGVNEDRWGLTHLVRANALVIAHVPEELEVEVPLRQSFAHLTGRVVRRRYLELPGLRLPLFLYGGLEGTSKMEKVTRAPEVFGAQLPFEITRESYIFYEEEELMVSPETALKIAQKELARREKAAFGDAILSREMSAATENGVLTLRGTYLVERDIAKQAEITVFDRKELAKPKKPRDAGY